MGMMELFLIAVGLSMDAFAVSICKGLCLQKMSVRRAALVGLFFGGFQGLMPLIGWVLGSQFEQYIVSIDHWIAFVLLALIGGNMLKDAFSKCDCCEEHDADISFKTMFVMAIATSIDALAVGISLSMAGNVNIWIAICLLSTISELRWQISLPWLVFIM